MIARQMAGSCRNGAERDHGRLYHYTDEGPYGLGRALCGARPGRHSAGWGYQAAERATCPRCLKKAERRADGEDAGAAAGG